MKSFNTEAHALEFLLNWMLTTPEPESGRILQPEDLERMPEIYKKAFAKMLVGYAATCGSAPVAPLWDAICKEAKKKSHSDHSFGLAVKQILGKVI